MCNKKRLARVWEPSDPRGTEPYPDLAGLHVRGDGSGFNTSKAVLWFMANIIPEIKSFTQWSSLAGTIKNELDNLL